MTENNLLNYDRSRYNAIFMQISAAILWSMGGLLIKLVELNPIAIAGIRSLIAVFVIMFFLKKSVFKLTWNKVFGAVSYTSMVILFVCATKATTAANAILLQYTSPIYIAILGGWLLHERAKLREWITILFVIGGMTLFFLDNASGGSIRGNILGVLSGVAMAFNTIFMRRQKNADPLENVFWGSILTVIVSIPFMATAAPSHKGWVGLILLGILQLGVPYILYSKAIKKITALEATFLSLIEPLLNPLWVFLTVGEIPGKLPILGGVIVLVSVIVSCFRPKGKVLIENLISRNGD